MGLLACSWVRLHASEVVRATVYRDKKILPLSVECEYIGPRACSWAHLYTREVLRVTVHLDMHIWDVSVACGCLGHLACSWVHLHTREVMHVTVQSCIIVYMLIACVSDEKNRKYFFGVSMITFWSQIIEKVFSPFEQLSFTEQVHS